MEGQESRVESEHGRLKQENCELKANPFYVGRFLPTKINLKKKEN